MIACSSCQRYTVPDNSVYYGAEDFGYQLDNPSPYADWLPLHKKNSVFYYGLSGPHGTIEFTFIRSDQEAPFPRTIHDTLGLSQDGYVIVEQGFNDKNGKKVYEAKLKLVDREDEGMYARIALFPFDEQRIAVIYGSPSDTSRKHTKWFDKSFDTIVWSLEPIDKKVFQNFPEKR